MTSLSVSTATLEQSILLLQQEQIITTNGNTTNTTAIDLGIVQENSSSSTTTSNGNGSSLTNNSNLSVDVLAVLVQSQTTSTTPATPTTQAHDSDAQQSPLHDAFHKLVEALKSGSLTDAQSAYNNLLKIESTLSNASIGSTANSPAQQSFQQALNQIGIDLQQNNLSGAQQVLSQLPHDHHEEDQGDNRSGVRGLLRQILAILNKLTNGNINDQQSSTQKTVGDTQLNSSTFTLAVVDNSTSTQLTTT